MKAWLYESTAGGLEKNLKLHEDAREPTPHLEKNEIRVRTLAMSVNPVDYKVAEIPLVGSAVIGYPASPGMDFSAKVIATGSTIDHLAVGEIVYGKLDKPCKFGPLGDIMIVKAKNVVQKPAGLSNEDAATIGVCGMTAYQSIAPFVESGDHIFINGGSGGTGTFGIQIAKQLGCHVTTSCSGPNMQLCEQLGADDVINYRESNVTEVLKARGQVYDFVVDNIGSPSDLHSASHHFLKPTGRYVQIGGEASQATTIMSRALRPGFLGGGKRPWKFLSVQMDQKALKQMGDWMVEGKVKAVKQEVFAFEDAPKAYEASRTGRSKGKIVVTVNSE